MTDTALHLEQRVLPEVPIRHWIGSLPWGLRALVGYDRRLCARVLAAFVGELARSLRRRAKRLLFPKQRAHAQPITPWLVRLAREHSVAYRLTALQLIVRSAVVLAVLLYLVPVMVLTTMRSRRATALWEVALDIPSAVSLDLLTLFVAAHLVKLETAILVSRGVWIAVGVTWILWRRSRGDAFAFPSTLGKRESLGLAIAVAIGACLSLQLSRPYSIWDRELHIGLSSVLRAQSTPFANVFDPGIPLRYHLVGDVLAATLQTLSGDVIHSSLALSVGHDVMFALTAATMALLLMDFGIRRLHLLSLLVAAVFLNGPVTWRGGSGLEHIGYSYQNYLNMSFRPHTALGGLLLVGFVGSLAVRWRFPRVAVRASLFPLIASAALLALTDEASTALLGFSLGMAWLVDPNTLHPSRKWGLGILAALLVTVVLSNLVFSATMAPGGPVRDVAIVPWRSPGGWHRPSLPLSTDEGLVALLCDLLPMLLCAVAIMSASSQSYRHAPMKVFCITLLGTGVVLLTRVEVEHAPDECHRFICGAAFLLPLLSGSVWNQLNGSWGRLAAIAGLTVGSLSTIEWRIETANSQCMHPEFLAQKGPNLYEVNCRAQAGAHLGDEPRLTYVDQGFWYYYAGCRPIYSAGVHGALWEMKLYPDAGKNALKQLVPKPGAEPLVQATCPRGQYAGKADPICAAASQRDVCRTNQGTDFVTCELQKSDYESLLALP